jgi:hypothetical protein
MQRTYLKIEGAPYHAGFGQVNEAKLQKGLSHTPEPV